MSPTKLRAKAHGQTSGLAKAIAGTDPIIDAPRAKLVVLAILIRKINRDHDTVSEKSTPDYLILQSQLWILSKVRWPD